jgi:hypothetical protein
MGYVQTLREIELGMVAPSENFPQAIEETDDTLTSWYNESRIYGVLRQGSSSEGIYMPGSDVDHAIVSSSEDVINDVAQDILSLREYIFQKYHVPLEFKPHFSVDEAKAAIHRLDRKFMFQLRTYSENGSTVIGNNPLEIVRQLPLELVLDEKRELIDEMRDYHSQVVEQTRLPDPNDKYYCLHLERLMRRPLWAAYDMILLNHPLPYADLREWEPTYEHPLTEDGRIPSKERIMELYAENFPDLDAEEHLERIMEIRSKYRDFLANFREIGNPAGIYPSLLSEVQSLEPDARAFFSKNLNHLIYNM